jgi:hypothetical protein
MIEKLIQSNIGGAYLLRMVAARNITSFPSIRNNQISISDFSFVAGIDWEDWKFRPEVLNWEEDNIGEAGSDSYTSIVDGAIPKDRPEILQALTEKLNDRWVVLVYFHNKIDGSNTIVCLGSKDEPARLFRGKRNGGRAVTDFNGTNFFFQVTGRLTPSPFVLL